MRKMMNRPEVLSVLWHQEAAGLLLLFPGRAGVWSTEVSGRFSWVTFQP